MAVRVVVGLLLLVGAWWLLTLTDDPREALAPLAVPTSTAPDAVVPMELEVAGAEAKPVPSVNRPRVAVPRLPPEARLTRPPAAAGEAPTRLRIVDEAGAPLSGALLWPVHGERSGMGHADEQGVFDWPSDGPAVPRLHVTALGHELLGVERGGDVWQLPEACDPRYDPGDPWEGVLLHHELRDDVWPEEVRVVVPRVAMLHLTVTPSEGPGAEDAYVTVRARAERQPVATRWPALVAHELGLAGWSGWPGELYLPGSERHEFMDRVAPPFLREIHLAGLVPHVPIQLEVAGPHGSPLAGREVMLTPGRWDELTLSASSRRYGLSGQVVRGELPVPEAEVIFYPSGDVPAAGGMALTDEDGRFRFDLLAVDTIDIHAMYARYLRQVRLPRDEPLVIDLEVADSEHVIHIVEAGSGRGLLVDDVRVVPNPNMHFQAEPVGEPGRYTASVPVGDDYTVAIAHGGVDYVAPLAAGDETTVTLPRGGQLELTWDAALLGDGRGRLLLDLPGREPMWDWRFGRERGATGWTWDYLPPGRHTVTLQREDEEPESSAEHAQSGPRPSFTDVARGTIDLGAGEQLTLELSPLP